MVDIIEYTKMNNTTKNADTERFDMENNKYIEEPWTIIESYFKDKHLDTHSYSKNPHKNSFMSAFLQKLRKILMKHMRRYGENENILVRRAFLNWYVYARALVSVLKVVCLSVMCAREGVRKCTCIRECTVMRRNPKVNEFSLTTPHAQRSQSSRIHRPYL